MQKNFILDNNNNIIDSSLIKFNYYGKTAQYTKYDEIDAQKAIYADNTKNVTESNDNDDSNIEYITCDNIDDYSQIIDDIEDKIADCLCENVEVFDARNCGSDNDAYYYIDRYAPQVINDYILACDDYKFECDNEETEDYTSIIECILDKLNYNSLCDVINEIANTPITMEEKMHEVGMSQKDFL